MPPATVDTSRVAALVAEAAEAAGAALGVTSLLAGNVGEGTLAEEFVPGPGSRAVATRTRGLDGRIVLIVSARIVDEVLAGPLGGQDFGAALEPALQRAVAVLDQAAPRALRMDPPHEVDATVEMASAEQAWWWTASPLFAGEDHEGSLVVILDDPASTRPNNADVDADFDDAADEQPLDRYTPPPAPPAHGQVAPATLAGSSTPVHPLRLLHDVEMDVTVELGRTRMSVRNILGLTPGAVIELDRAAGAPVDLLVNGTLIGRGEVVVIDEEFGVRISEIVGRTDELH